MKTKRDYSKSNAKAFDAVEDIKGYFGDRWEKVSLLMRDIPNVQSFSTWANFAGIEGYPIEAWYDLYFGQGSYRKALALEGSKL